MVTTKPIESSAVSALIFDAYGTLLDVMAIARKLDDRWPGRGTEIARLWRIKQIEYTLLRTLGERYDDFAAVTRDALRYTSDQLDLDADSADIDRAMQAYMTLPPHPEVAEALMAIRTLGLPMAVLSNGTVNMLTCALDRAGISGHFEAILSVDQVRCFKTSPAAYRLGTHHFGLPPDRILFISSNGWDIAGAGWFGYRCLWLNRAGLPSERLGFEPQHRGRSLSDIVALLEQG